MSGLREAAQQALDWLYDNDILHPSKVSEDLRTALAQQAESEGGVCARCGALAFDPVVPQCETQEMIRAQHDALQEALAQWRAAVPPSEQGHL